jgi:hypothetical protein
MNEQVADEAALAGPRCAAPTYDHIYLILDVLYGNIISNILSLSSYQVGGNQYWIVPHAYSSLARSTLSST